MTHVSRPFQVGLAAVAVFAAVWLVALRGHSTPGGSASSGGQQQAPQPSAPAPLTSSPYTGPAPGVAGLTRDIEKARGAVAQSERNAQQLQQKSNQASSAATATVPSPASSATGAQRSSAGTSSASKATTSHATATKTHKPAVAHRKPKLPVSRTTPARQPQVEAQLKAGKTVAILFWNPHAGVDRVVRSELQAAQRAFRGKVAVELAQANEVGAFGSFTRAVQVLETPTILLVNPHGQTSSLTGLTDAFSLQQAIREARR